MDSPGFVWLLSYSSWFCLASTTHLIQIRSGAEHQILFLFLSMFFYSLHGFSPGFAQLLSHSSWFCLASTTRLIQIRSGTLDFSSSLHGFSPGFVGFFPTATGFVWLPQLDSVIQIRSGEEHRISFLLWCRSS